MNVTALVSKRMNSRFVLAIGAVLLAIGALPLRSGPSSTASGQTPTTQAEQVLPTRSVVIDVDAPEQSLYRIAVPNLLGDATLGGSSADVLRNDFRLVSLFDVLDARSFVADLNAERLNVVLTSWSAVGAQGVIKGEIRGTTGSRLEVELRLYELARGPNATLTRTYSGAAAQLRGFMHDFANEVLRVLTGEAGSFGTRLTFARRVGPGRKDVYVSGFDGFGVNRVSSGRGVAMLPAFGPSGVWYSVLSQAGMFITRTGTDERSIVGGTGIYTGVGACGSRIVFSSNRDGDSDIYTANPDGTDVRQLTDHPGIDVSPTCGSGGIAFVSDRHGGPQIFVMPTSGGTPRRVTYRGEHNQTPAWCPKEGKPLLAFSGRSGGFDVFTVDLQGQVYTRLTQGQGVNKDPAFSPDCRMVAFASSRGGVFLSNPEGLNQNLVVPGAAETVRWSR